MDPSQLFEPEETKWANAWKSLQRSNPPDDEFKKARAVTWARAGCAVDGGPYVISNILKRLNNPQSNTPQLQQAFYAESWRQEIAAKFLSIGCLGARNIDEDKKAQLRKIRDAPAKSALPAPPAAAN